MVNLVILGVVALILVYCGYYFVSSYSAAEGSTWDKLLAAAKNSATMLWGYTVMAGSSMMVWSVNAADAVNLPDVRNFIQAHLSPEMFGLTLFAVALLSVFARLRTL